MDGVAELGVGGRGAAPDDPAEVRVVGQLPVHGDALRGQSAVGLVRLRGQPGPQQDRAGQRVAGGHAQREGVVGDSPGVELGGGGRAGGGQVHSEGERRGGAGDGEEAAPAELPGGGAQFGGVLGRAGCGCHPVSPLSR